MTQRRDLVIQKSAWGWSLYNPDGADEGELAALVCSADDPYSLVRYALENLEASVRVLPVPELFTK